MCGYEKRRGNSRDNRKIPSHWAEDKCDASGRDALMSLIFSFIEKSFLFQFVVFSVGLCTVLFLADVCLWKCFYCSCESRNEDQCTDCCISLVWSKKWYFPITARGQQ